jgi:hypothetical protein
MLSESEIVESFLKNLNCFSDFYNIPKLRLYMAEMPIFTKDGTKSADIVLISETENMHNCQFYILEFKKDKVDFQSATAQVIRYADMLKKQLYLTKRVLPFVIAPDFSEAERKLAASLNVTLNCYDWVSGRLLASD